MIRVGFSKDIHNKIYGRELFLGGLKFESNFSIEAYSDGDVVLHSICEALLGAMGMNDLGTYFNSNTNEKKFSSIIISKFVLEKLKVNKYTINNIDCMLQIDDFIINNFVDEIKNNLAKLFCINSSKISIKATTSENNFKNFVECSTIVSIKENSND